MTQVVMGWRFFGPRAAGIAAHHARHLAERLSQEGVPGAVATEALGPGAWEVRCVVPPAAAEALAAALRPHAQWTEAPAERPEEAAPDGEA